MSDHHHHHAGSNLKLAFFLNLFFTIVELVGGVFVNSVAIISDAIHDLGDCLSLGSAWFLQEKSKKKADARFTFGYGRLSLLAALINSIVLIVGGIFVIRESIIRFSQPEPVDSMGMLGLALIGVTVNGYAAWKVSHGKSLNEQVISWHLLEDVLGWVAVLVVSVVVYFTDWYILDPILSLLITLFILFGVYRRLNETISIFLQGSPKEMDVDLVIRQIEELEHVHSLHHTHAWSLEGENHVFTTHVKLHHLDSLSQLMTIKRNIKAIVRAHKVVHFTIELELDGEDCELNG